MCPICGSHRKSKVARVTIRAALWGVSPARMPESIEGRLEWYQEAVRVLSTVKGDNAWHSLLRIAERIRILEKLIA